MAKPTVPNAHTYVLILNLHIIIRICEFQLKLDFCILYLYVWFQYGIWKSEDLFCVETLPNSKQASCKRKFSKNVDVSDMKRIGH